jgi:hypothetical protein
MQSGVCWFGDGSKGKTTDAFPMWFGGNDMFSRVRGFWSMSNLKMCWCWLYIIVLSSWTSLVLRTWLQLFPIPLAFIGQSDTFSHHSRVRTHAPNDATHSSSKSSQESWLFFTKHHQLHFQPSTETNWFLRIPIFHERFWVCGALSADSLKSGAFKISLAGLVELGHMEAGVEFRSFSSKNMEDLHPPKNIPK